MLHVPTGRACLALILAPFLLPLVACGGGGSVPREGPPFVAHLPDDVPGGGGEGTQTPPPPPGLGPVFDADAFTHDRTAFFGSFSSDLVVRGTVAYVNDADQIEAGGARIVPLDVSAATPRAAENREPVFIEASDLVDGSGAPGDLARPVGLGFFVGEIEVVAPTLGFVLVGAGGSDSSPPLSNLVAFDPTAGQIVQVVDLTHPLPAAGREDSSGQPVPAEGFRQAGAEGLCFVPTAPGRGLLYIAFSNLVFGAPSYGAVKYPGSIQVYEVVLGAATPVRPWRGGTLPTRTIVLEDYNPVALQRIVAEDGSSRVLATVGGATGYDETFALVAKTAASVRAFDGETTAYLGRFELGLAGLSFQRPALGIDEAGHRVGFFPSAVNGEVYLLRLDGLYEVPVDETSVSVLRGPGNGIPIARDDAGGPGGNVTSVALVGRRWLVVAGFGDLFAFPAPKPGRLYLLNLPPDLVTGSGFGTNFVPGWTRLEVLPERTVGTVAPLPSGGGRPSVLVAVSGIVDGTTYAGLSPASVGALWLGGLDD